MGSRRIEQEEDMPMHQLFYKLAVEVDIFLREERIQRLRSNSSVINH